MIVGGYTLDLYCDHSKHAERHPDKTGSLDAQFVGHGAGDCRNQARAKGWRLDLYKGTAYCRKCQRLDREERAK